MNTWNSWRNSVIHLKSSVAFKAMHLNLIMTRIIHKNIHTQKIILNHSYQRRQLFIIMGRRRKDKKNSQRKAITLIQLWWHNFSLCRKTAVNFLWPNTSSATDMKNELICNIWFYLLLETTAEIRPNNLTDVVFGITDKPNKTDVFHLQATTGVLSEP